MNRGLDAWWDRQVRELMNDCKDSLISQADSEPADYEQVRHQISGFDLTTQASIESELDRRASSQGCKVGCSPFVLFSLAQSSLIGLTSLKEYDGRLP